MQSTRAPTHTAAFAAEVEDVCFAYGARRALSNLSIRVPNGSIFGLLGPNGSGKSTLLALLAGLRAPDSGKVRTLGQSPSPALRARIGVLYQENCLDPLMTVRETMRLHGRLFCIPASNLERDIDSALASVGLSDRSEHLTETLSGGMRRRLALARILLPSPSLLLLDEPTTGLDPDSEQAIWSRLLDMNRQQATIILATNEVREADRYCTDVAFIHDGEFVAQGTPEQMKAGLKRDSVWVEWPGFVEAQLHMIKAWPGIGNLRWSPPVLHATVDSASTFVPRLFEIADGRITGVRIRESTLEDAYFDIVGARLIGEGSE